MKRFILLTLITLLYATSAQALIIWNWFTTDGPNTAAGTLTTSGDISDLSGGLQTFALQSIDSVDSISGPDVSSDPSNPANWNFGDAPSFSDIVIGNLNWDGTTATVGSGGLVAMSLASMSGNLVGIGEAGVTASTALRIAGGTSFYDFIPTASTFSPVLTAVPESSTGIPLLLLLVCYMRWTKTKTSR